MAINNVTYEIDGYEIVTTALKQLLNQFPALSSTEEIDFSVNGQTEGISFFPVSGAIVVNTNPLDVTGRIEQNCAYPFIVLYKSSGLTQKAKINVKEWLDTLGKWLEKQIITVSGTDYQLTNYPPLKGGEREFKEIRRTTPSYLYEVTEDKVETWAINLTAYYKNAYDRI